MGRMQREKGKRGEREVVALMRAYGFEARRGQQYRGGGDSPDIIHNIRGVYIEVKFREQLSLYPVLEETERGRELSCARSVVFYRRKTKPWVVVMYAEDYLELMQEVEK